NHPPITYPEPVPSAPVWGALFVAAAASADADAGRGSWGPGWVVSRSLAGVRVCPAVVEAGPGAFCAGSGRVEGQVGGGRSAGCGFAASLVRVRAHGAHHACAAGPAAVRGALRHRTGS